MSKNLQHLSLSSKLLLVIILDIHDKDEKVALDQAIRVCMVTTTFNVLLLS